TAAAVFYAVSTHVQDLGKERVHPVFLIDEAHLLHPEMLGHLHILLNYEWDSKALLSLILVGLPELKDQLQLRRYRSLHSRLHWRLHIDPLTPEDTAEYLRYRMKRAGCDRDVFTHDAVAMLHEAATGGMRDLDRLATGCLREAARKKRKLVERDLLPRVLDRDGLEVDR
uniref:ExeA family protein n=1 Tax=Anaeromyxobacter oryzisoli TaxID=2925408 RepID=UPI001F5AD7B7